MAAQRLTIFEKLQIVEYADKLIADSRAAALSDHQSKKGKKHSVRGLNVQKKCQEHFGSKLGGIKVCVLRKHSEDQKWRDLTEKQQKTFYQLPDSVKVSLGLQTVKGYKSLPPGKVQDRLKDDAELPRLNVPGPVLEARLYVLVFLYCLRLVR